MVPALFATLFLGLPGALSDESDPYRQFDFWLGEWSVNNRFLQPDATWADGGRARARITPVLGGRAVFEEWSGKLERGPVFGLSLRAWDPEDREWVLLLNWPGAERASFGVLRGRFRHGRGVFFSGGPDDRTRYSFSDTLPDSIRWDSARSTDGGETWRTDWIMEFSRTAPAARTDAELFDVAWESERACPLEGARELDFLVGSWSGVHRVLGSEGATEARAHYRAAEVIRGWALVDSLRIDAAEGPDHERLTVRGYLPGTPSWECWSLTRADTRLTSTRGSVEFAAGVFRGRDRNGPVERRIVLEDDDVIAIEEHRERNGTWTLVARTELRRDHR